MLPGIRLCCCWSKLRRASPCWPASNPPLMHAVRAGTGALLTGTVSLLHDPTERRTFSLPLLGTTTYSNTPEVSGEHSARAIWQTAERPGCSHKAGKAAVLPCPLPQFPISERASRQTGVTYQHDIVQPRFSCFSQSNGNFKCIPLCSFFMLIFTGGTDKSQLYTHTERGQWERVLLSVRELQKYLPKPKFLPFINIF